MHLIRHPALMVLAMSLLAAACTAEDEQVPSADSTSSASPVTVEQVASTPEEDTLSALTNRFHAEHPDPLIDPDEVTSGGPPPDGIPPIDEPKFLPADEVGFLEDTEPVLALTVGDESRAYPVQVMIWHEIVNDTIDGVPVTVTYCPLCNSAIAYDRRLGDRILDFGTSGLLYNSALVMYDRQTETLWSHFTGEAAIGHLTGEVLDVLPVSTVSWEDWREANPDGLVLSRDTGFDRSYGTNPYPGYDDIDSAPFLFDGEVDGRLAAKERVLGIERAGEAAAVRLDTLREDGVRELDLGSTSWSPGCSTARRQHWTPARCRTAATSARPGLLPSGRRPGADLRAHRRGLRRRADRHHVERARRGRHRTAGRRAAGRGSPRRHVLVRLGCLPARHGRHRLNSALSGARGSRSRTGTRRPTRIAGCRGRVPPRRPAACGRGA